ncbi:MAG: EAL domain-containing protein [Agarilytica sp.]
MTNDVTYDTPINEQDIRSAFEHSHFSLVYQPQVSLDDVKKVFGLEAFVRLDHPKHGVLGPQSFFPFIVKADLSLKLAETTLSLVAKHWAQLYAQGYDLLFSVNIETSLLGNREFIKTVETCLGEHNMPLEALKIELCDCDFDELENGLKQQLLNLHMKGIGLSLNDFEDATNAIATLKDLPINEIKVKTNVVTQIRTHAHAQTMFRKALYLSQQYGLRIVAVGIEHKPEVAWLHKQGCNRGQGYLFGQPMPIRDLCKYLAGDVKGQSRQKESLKLLIVEDDIQYRVLLEESLNELYQVYTASSTDEALKVFSTEQPELIILDVHLPDGTGIDLCRDLKAQSKSPFSAVFVSGSEDSVHKLQAYDVGAIDFLQKPCPFNLLVAKMGHVAAFHKKRQELETSSHEAQAVAVHSLREAAYYGDIIQFFKNLLSCRDEQGMAQEVFSFMQQKDLSCSVQFRNSDATSSFTQHELVCSPIEMDVFNLLHEKGRIYEFGDRTIFNDHLVSILIKKMPQDVDERGRVRDYAAVILEGIEARYKDILRHRLLQTVFQQLQGLAEDLVVMVKNEMGSKHALVDKFSVELGMSFHVLQLTIEQEEYITKIIEKMVTEKESTEISANDIHDRISDIMTAVSNAINELDNDTPERQSDNENTIELF